MKYQKLVFGLLICCSLFILSCASKIILEDKNPTAAPVTESTPEPKVDDADARLKSVQTGNFEFVFIFRLKNGEAFSSEDKRFLKENTPDANQRQLSSDEKAVVIGSNFAFPPENLDALKKRFKIEDYSPKKEANVNANR